MVDYEETDLISKIQHEVGLKRQFEQIKQEQQKQLINSQKQKVLNFYDSFL